MSTQLPHEIVDLRLDILEAENARFDERVAESIKRLSDSGQITSSSGNAINVKGAPDKLAAKAEFFGGGDSSVKEALEKAEKEAETEKTQLQQAKELFRTLHLSLMTESLQYLGPNRLIRGTSLKAFSGAGCLAQIFFDELGGISQDLENAHHKYGPQDIVEAEPDCSNTLPPHIMRITDEIKIHKDNLANAENIRLELSYNSDQHVAAMEGIDVKFIQPLNAIIIKLRNNLVEETLKHFGGEA